MRKKAGRVFFALTVLATLAAGYYAWRHWQLASDQAKTTALTIEVDRRPVTGKNTTGMPWRYTAAYTFADESGTVRSGRQTIDASRYDELANRASDAPVAVYFSRSHPEVSTLNPNSSRNIAAILGVIALVGWGLMVARNMRG